MRARLAALVFFALTGCATLRPAPREGTRPPDVPSIVIFRMEWAVAK